MQLLAIDLGKQSFHVHGITNDGEVISKKVSRSKLETTVEDLSPENVAMEACASSHHWGRRFEAMGYPVRLIHPRFVMPFVKGSKNDAVDAEAIHEAALRPTMRFVPVKTTEQQDLQMLHRTRDRLITQRTGLINHIRGLLGEYGVVIPVGAFRFRKDIRNAVAEAKLSALATENFSALIAEFEALDTRVKLQVRANTTKTKTARLRSYVRDERPCCGAAPPCAWYQFSVDRKGERPANHLAGYTGKVHADGFAGFNGPFGLGKADEQACMVHVRRKFVYEVERTGSPIAQTVSAVRKKHRLR